jgi:uncharacterized protein with HEPN domain
MSVHDPGLTLRQIVEFADEVAALVSRRTREDFDANREFRRALERCVELVGEAATRLPVDWRESHQQVPWRQITAMRNVMIRNRVEEKECEGFKPRLFVVIGGGRTSGIKALFELVTVDCKLP